MEVKEYKPERLDMLSDVNLKVAVQLGKTNMKIADILNLKKGSLIELDTMADQPVEIFINGILMGYGEVVVVDDKFGVRIKEIINRKL